jgi:hypothetical protein
MTNVVSGDAILKTAGDGTESSSIGVTIDRLAPLQEAGVRFALGVGVLAFLVLLVLGVQWLLHSPVNPTLPSPPAKAEDMPQYISSTKAMLDNYKILSDQAWDGPSKLFDVVIVKILYPLFTLILGYVFGAKVESARAAREGDAG